MASNEDEQVRLGTIDVGLLLSLLLGSLPGIFMGSALVMRIPELVLRYTLATVLALVAGRLLLPIAF
jgi:uncharacterized membrane protein YfcA